MKMENLEDYIIDKARDVFGEVYSIGSSSSFTYIPNEHGLSEDIDLYIMDATNKDIADLIIKVNEKKELLERKFKHVYGRDVELRVQKAEDNEEGDFKQVFYSVIDKKTKKQLLKIDFNYDENMDGTEGYRGFFKRQLNKIVSNLPDKEKEAAKEYIVANIRGLKSLLIKNKVYKASEGGLTGIGCEQLILQLYENPNAKSREEIKRSYSVGNALEKIYNEKENLMMVHPTAENRADLTEKLYRKDNAGWKKIIKLAKDYDIFKYQSDNGGN